MLSEKLMKAMNEQIKHEFYSAYLYLGMSAYFEAENLPGFAKWMKIQAKEEQGHALKFFEFIHDRGGRVQLGALEQPAVLYESPKAVFSASLAHEKKVTSLIENLYTVATQEKDYASQVFLQWFINEQVEEEKNASQILDMLEKVGNAYNGIMIVDHHLARREE